MTALFAIRLRQYLGMSVLGIIALSVISLSIIPNLVYLPPYADKMLHINIFALCMIIAILRLSRAKHIGIALAFLTALGLAIELAQSFIPSRSASLDDMIANIIGIAAGTLIGVCYRHARAHTKTTFSMMIFVFLIFSSFLSPSISHAQFLTRDDAVKNITQLPDDDFDAIGGQIGMFKVDVGATLEHRLDDNIFRIEDNTTRDQITAFKPFLSITPDWIVHDINVRAGAEIARYHDNDSENYSDYFGEVSGTYDLDFGSNIAFLTRFSHLHEGRGSVDDPDGDSPLEFNVLQNKITYARTGGLLRLRAGFEDRHTSFEDTTISGVNVNNDIRDYKEQIINARLSYGLTPQTEAFIAPSYTWTSYAEPGSNDRSSTGYAIAAGLAYDLTGKLRVDAYGGYFERNLDNSAVFGDIGGANYGGSLLWNPTDLTSITGGVKRAIRETTQTAASGVIQTRADLGFAHSLTRRTTVDANVGLENNAYDGGINFNRDDDIVYADIGAEYKFFRGAALQVKHSYIDRDSNIAGGGFRSHVTRIGLGYAY